MTLPMVVNVLLIVFAAGATVLAAVATRKLLRLDKQARQMLEKMERTEATATRILDREYRFQKQAEILFADPKVVAALNRYEERHSG